MRLLIAADLSLASSGITIIDIDKGSPVHYESISSGLSDIERLSYNYNRYMNLFATYRDTIVIAFEEQTPQMRYAYSAGSILNLAENVGIWKLAIYHSLPVFREEPVIVGIPAQDIKKYATDNGKATKEDMIAAVNGNHMKSIRRDIPEHSVNDVADSYHLAKMAREGFLNDSIEFKKYIFRDYRKLLESTTTT